MRFISSLVLTALYSCLILGCSNGGGNGGGNGDQESSQSGNGQSAVFESAPYSQIHWYTEDDRSTDFTIEYMGENFPHRVFVSSFDGVNHRRTLFIDPQEHPEVYQSISELFLGQAEIYEHANPSLLSTPYTVVELEPSDESMEQDVIYPKVEETHLRNLREFILQLLETQ